MSCDYTARMENGHSCGARDCAPSCQVKHTQATGSAQGCNGDTCEDGKMSSAPVPQKTDCSSIYCDSATAAGRPLSPLERRKCFKCTSKAEVQRCADLVLVMVSPMLCTGGTS